MNSLFSVALVLWSNVILAQTFIPKDDESVIKFNIRNFRLKTEGSMRGLQGVVEFSPEKPEDASVQLSVRSETIETGIELRDKHLRKSEYLNSTLYPEIKIQSGNIKQNGSTKEFYFHGFITIKKTTKEISFPFKATKTSDGYIFNGFFIINRRHFEVGGRSLSLADDVEVMFNIVVNKREERESSLNK